MSNRFTSQVFDEALGRIVRVVFYDLMSKLNLFSSVCILIQMRLCIFLLVGGHRILSLQLVFLRADLVVEHIFNLLVR